MRSAGNLWKLQWNALVYYRKRAETLFLWRLNMQLMRCTESKFATPKNPAPPPQLLLFIFFFFYQRECCDINMVALKIQNIISGCKWINKIKSFIGWGCKSCPDLFFPAPVLFFLCQLDIFNCYHKVINFCLEIRIKKYCAHYMSIVLLSIRSCCSFRHADTI